MSVPEREPFIQRVIFCKNYVETFEKFNTTSVLSESFSKNSLKLFKVSHIDLS